MDLGSNSIRPDPYPNPLAKDTYILFLLFIFFLPLDRAVTQRRGKDSPCVRPLRREPGWWLFAGLRRASLKVRGDSSIMASFNMIHGSAVLYWFFSDGPWNQDMVFVRESMVVSS